MTHHLLPSKGVQLAAFFVFAFLYIPLIVVVIYSFNSSRLNAEWVSFSTQWYHTLFANDELI